MVAASMARAISRDDGHPRLSWLGERQQAEIADLLRQSAGRALKNENVANAQLDVAHTLTQRFARATDSKEIDAVARMKLDETRAAADEC